MFPNRTSVFLSLLLAALTIHLSANPLPEASRADSTILSETPYSISKQERFERHWTKVITRRDLSTGEITNETKGYIELASGLNYLDETGQALDRVS